MERKFATALFADLVGSTALAEQQDPEVVQSVVGRTFDRLSVEIERYGGHLEKYMGDAVLAVFGIPRAHEDDPERAVRAGLEMQAVLAELNRGFAAEGKPTLRLRIGIEAGEVLVDLERVTGPRDRMLTGDAVNTAARLQAAAEPGRVVVGSGVRSAVRGVIELVEMPALDLKGKAQPVPAWEARSVIAKRRGERPSLGMQAPLIGRDEELAVLKQTLHRVEAEGRPALVTLIGPAGVGKSRLAREVRDHLDGLPGDYYWRSGRCLAYGNAAYSALAEAVKGQCECLEDDPLDVALAKTAASVEELFGDRAIVPQLSALLTASERIHSREDLFEAWRRYLERMAARYPLVLVMEDIHWADEGLLDFIEHLADWGQGPILVMCQSRPELLDRRPTWGGGKRNAVTITLDPLSPDEDAAMVDELLPGAIGEDLRRMIVDRAEGNPLFTEEIVRMLVDRGTVRATEASRWELAAPVADVDVPRSIQGLIAARLDGLPPDEKAVLQDAAVVGRTFWLGAVAMLAGLTPGATRDALGRLRVKELIVPHEPSSLRDEPEFTFRHTLLRDGAYDSLPKSLRATKHEAVAAWAVERAGDRVEEIAAVVATHVVGALGYRDELGDGGSAREAAAAEVFRWTMAAGDRAARVWSMSEAVRWYGAAVDLGEPATPDERIRALRSLLDAGWGTLPMERLESTAVRLRALAEAAGDVVTTGYAWAWLAKTGFELGIDDDEVLRRAETAIGILEALDETWQLAHALRVHGWFLWRRGRAAEAEPILRRAVEVAERTQAPVVLAEATMDLTVVLSMLGGRKRETLEFCDVSFALAKASGDYSVLIRAYNNVPTMLVTWNSEFARAAEIVEEGIQRARKAGGVTDLAWLTGSLGDFALITGRIADSERLQREALEGARRLGEEPLVGMRLSALAGALIEQGRLDEAPALLDEAEAIFREHPEPQADVGVRRWRATLAYFAGDDEEVVARLTPTIEAAREYHVDYAAEAFVMIARSLVRLGRRDEARAYRDLSERAESPFATAMGLVVDGVLAVDPGEQIALFGEAVTRLEALGARPEAGRVLIDLASAERRAGLVSTATYARARELLSACGARGWLPFVDAADHA